VNQTLAAPLLDGRRGHDFAKASLDWRRCELHIYSPALRFTTSFGEYVDNKTCIGPHRFLELHFEK
jgi:hypothetical protein